MGLDQPTSLPTATAANAPWYRTLTGYQWFVFIVCCLAWDMDCTDQQLFTLARRPAMIELVPKVESSDPRLPALKQKLEANVQAAKTEAEVIKAQQDADVADAAGWATTI